MRNNAPVGFWEGRMMRKLLALLSSGLLVATTAGAQTVIDFETEDDFTTPLVNGQIVDPAFDPASPEFGNLFTLTTTTNGHIGATIFDSDPLGPNQFGGDPDLLIDQGNLLILQNTSLTNQFNDPTYGLLYTEPDDEAGVTFGAGILFSFLNPVEMLSLDLIDANGGYGADVTLTDGLGNTRLYVVPEMWTEDAFSCVQPCNGFDTLDLTSLSPQLGEGGFSTTVVEGAGFDAADVLFLTVTYTGSSSSGGIDNVTFVPEPTTAVLVGLGLLGLGIARRRAA